MNAIIPIPRIPITIRPAVMDDLPFIDALQKKHSKQVGFLHRAALEQKIKAGHVLVAEEGARGQGQGASENQSQLPSGSDSSLAPRPSPLAPVSIGYSIGHDQYFKRDDVGVIYQMNVVPGRQRGFVGAMLLKAMFDRAAYGCRLFCCWCAQDIEANRFWEAMGFVPLAFRAGGRGRASGIASSSLAPCPSPLAPSARVHIFWQKRIREGDATTPWWFPSKTSSGSIREDRLVFPIPPGTHWSDAKPIILPGEETAARALPDETVKRPRVRKVNVKAKAGTIGFAALRFAKDVAKQDREDRADRRGQKMKNNPEHERMARQLRDVFLEQANADPAAMIATGKYDLCRELTAPPQMLPALPVVSATPVVSTPVISAPHLLTAA